MAVIPLFAFALGDFGVTIGLSGAAGLVGAIINELRDDDSPPSSNSGESPPTENTDRGDAKAPGKPTEKDGFDPDKRGGEFVKAPDGQKKGWRDKRGDIWIPTGQGSGDGRSRPHGGEHWDVISKNGDHRNVYPGGHVRGGN
ncbi:hypothetical protein TWF481_001096 [Arthrobotrys musiformis]|uniref:Toxin 37-like C-terminal domain-containing protein n=1 Tax=Arthrobotrys musiformis TaxID=47236 RepID=A0AAV9WPI8_9PEZI